MKLAITHTKTVPGQEDYSSEGFGATIEVEVPDEQSQDATVVRQWLQEFQPRSRSRSRRQPRPGSGR